MIKKCPECNGSGLVTVKLREGKLIKTYKTVCCRCGGKG